MSRASCAWILVLCSSATACGQGVSSQSDPRHQGAPAEVASAVVTTGRGASLHAEAREAMGVNRGRGGLAAQWLGSSPIEGVRADGGRYVPTLIAPRAQRAAIAVSAPATADGELRIEADGVRAALTPLAFASSAVEWSQMVAIYPDVQPGVHAFRRFDGRGVEDVYQVSAPRDVLEFRYALRTDGVGGLRVVAGALELLDGTGTPRITVPAPTLVDAAGAVRRGQIDVTDCAVDRSPLGPWGRPTVAPGAGTCTVVARIDGKALAYPVLFDPAWIGTTNLKHAHASHALLRLPGGPDVGKIIALGGTGTVGDVELFDPTTKTWALTTAFPTTPSVIDLGEGMAAVALSDGTVVASGGLASGSSGSSAQRITLRRLPATAAWVVAADMSHARVFHSLVDVTIGGKEVALAIGGQTTQSPSAKAQYLSANEYFDPTPTGTDYTGNWVTTGSLVSGPRSAASAIVLSTGKVLVAGGESYNDATFGNVYYSTTEIFDPTAKTFTKGPAMSDAREFAAAVALPSGNAVIAGGQGSSFDGELSSIEVYDGTAWTKLTATLSVNRSYLTGTLLDSGNVLFAGGSSFDASTSTEAPSASADLFIPGSAPKTGTVTATGIMSTVREKHAAVAIPGKGALVTGGLTDTFSGTETPLVDIYDTSVGGACGPTSACTRGLTCVDGVCCETASCGTGEKCNNPGHEGVCTKGNGIACGGNLECASGFCVDGVCCSTSCTGGCQACNVAGSEGKCVNAAKGTDPHAFCAGASGDPICGQACDGAGACFTPNPAGTPCGGSAGDAGGSFCNISACNATNTCTPATNNCGLKCASTVSCDEASKSCTADPTTVLPGYCLIANACHLIGDVNSADPTGCQVCNPSLSGTAWSIASKCMDGGVDAIVVDTGDDASASEAGDDASASETGGDGAVVEAGDDAATLSDALVADTGTTDAASVADTGAADSGALDATSADAGKPELPTGSACGCRTVGSNDRPDAPLAFAGLGAVLAATVARRRRRDGVR
jgi:hypothetical protein